MIKKYVTCAKVDEMFNYLSDYPGKCKLIAGGTDLMLELEKGQHSEAEILLDISRVPDLDQIKQDEDGTIHLGPMVTHNHVVGSKLLHEKAPLLVQACYGVGSPQIRNRGTIAGNLVTASPANDSISPLMALDAELTLRSREGSRKVKLADFYIGVRKTILHQDEAVIDIAFKGLNANQKSIYKKYALRKAQAISLVNASIIITMNENKVSDAQITLGAVAPVIKHAKQAEIFLVGKELNEDSILAASDLIIKDVSPISDIRSSADYRTKISSLLVKRGLRELNEGVNSFLPVEPVLLWGKNKPNQSKVNQTREFSDHSVINTRINGKEYTLETNVNKSLLRLIREDAGLTGTKEGCDEGECGACTVYLDGVAVMSCLVPASRADGAEIVTIEGLSQGDKLHPVQQAFIDEGAVQCGYCTPGFVMSAVKLFEEKDKPDVDEIKMAITGNLCRCTGYYKIVKAIESVAKS